MLFERFPPGGQEIPQNHDSCPLAHRPEATGQGPPETQKPGASPGF